MRQGRRPGLLLLLLLLHQHHLLLLHLHLPDLSGLLLQHRDLRLLLLDLKLLVLLQLLRWRLRRRRRRDPRRTVASEPRGLDLRAEAVQGQVQRGQYYRVGRVWHAGR